jgi:hypothetical protein
MLHPDPALHTTLRKLLRLSGWRRSLGSFGAPARKLSGTRFQDICEVTL